MERALVETNRRREIQMTYNREHGIVPQTIVKDVRDIIDMGGAKVKDVQGKRLSREERLKQIEALKKEMRHAAKLLEFEHAAYLRDQIKRLEEQ